jgi:excisionase family DNA binding protein
VSAISTDSHPISPSLSHPCPKNLGAAVGALEREKLLTVAQVAAKFGVCKATIYRLVEQGELPHIRVGNSIRIVAAASASGE